MALTKQQLLDLIILNLANESTITASEHRAIENALVDAIFTDKSQIGDIKEIACNQQYINDNFEPSSNFINEGLGKINGERYGWAICNGKNGTVDKGGNVSVGYSPSKGYTLTGPGINNGAPGEKTVTLQESQMPSHNHGYTGVQGNGWPDGSGDSTGVGSGGSYPRQTQLLNKGGGQSHNNMQPYIVTLFIQRIPV
jgi:hypothetical protein